MRRHKSPFDDFRSQFLAPLVHSNAKRERQDFTRNSENETWLVNQCVVSSVIHALTMLSFARLLASSHVRPAQTQASFAPSPVECFSWHSWFAGFTSQQSRGYAMTKVDSSFPWSSFYLFNSSIDMLLICRISWTCRNSVTLESVLTLIPAKPR